MSVNRIPKPQLKDWFALNLKGDPYIWMIVIALACFSSVAVYSATGPLAYIAKGGNTEYFLLKHLMAVVLGLLSVYLAHKVDFRWYGLISRLVLILSVFLLLGVYLFGELQNGATRAISIPLINLSFQPSDMAKIALIANLASMLSKRQQDISNLSRKVLLPMLIWCGVICGLIALSDLSTAILLLFSCGLLFFIGRVPNRFFFRLGAVAIITLVAALYFGQRLETAASRVISFYEAWGNPELSSFQNQQSYVAIASGGIIGNQPGQSTQRNFLPQSYSDFIYAIIIEEYGALGGIIIIFLYLLLLWRGLLVAAKSEWAFGGLLSAGLSFLIVIQAFMNMGVAVGLLPVTGLPLPMVSWGGTSLLFTGMAFGIIISVSRGELMEEEN